MPRKPYRSPREWLGEDDRHQFGREREPEWLPAEAGLEAILLAAAQRQHSLALGIRTHRNLRGLKTEDMAARANISPSTVRGVLNGRIHATVSILFALTDAVGLDLHVNARRPAPEVEEGDP